MSEEKRGKKRPKSYYKKCAAAGKKAKSANDLDTGMKGFLVTCNKYEKESVREMYNLLNEYADELYGPEAGDLAAHTSSAEISPSTSSRAISLADKNVAGNVSESEEDEDDMEKAMAKERNSIVKTSSSERRFQNTDTKFKNLIFVRTTLEDPCELAYKMLSDMYAMSTQKARYAQRMIPVSVVCKAQMKNIETGLRTILKTHFETPFGVGLRYTSVCKIRNNKSVQRCAVLPLINRIVQEMNPLHKLCHDGSQQVVVVETIRNICCMSVIKDYFKFRKYNLQQVGKDAEESGEEEQVGDDKNENVMKSTDNADDNKTECEKAETGEKKVDHNDKGTEAGTNGTIVEAQNSDVDKHELVHVKHGDKEECVVSDDKEMEIKEPVKYESKKMDNDVAQESGTDRNKVCTENLVRNSDDATGQEGSSSSIQA